MTENKNKIQKGKYVLRSTYQKVCEENKRLLADIKVFCMEGISPERILLAEKWRNKFNKNKEFNVLLAAACKEYLKENPKYNIRPITPDGKRQSLINNKVLPVKK